MCKKSKMHLAYKIIINKNIFWNKEQNQMGQMYGLCIEFNIKDSFQIQTKLMEVLEAARLRWIADWQGRAATSQFHELYRVLDLELGGIAYIGNFLH